MSYWSGEMRDVYFLSYVSASQTPLSSLSSEDFVFVLLFSHTLRSKLCTHQPVQLCVIQNKQSFLKYPHRRQVSRSTCPSLASWATSSLWCLTGTASAFCPALDWCWPTPSCRTQETTSSRLTVTTAMAWLRQRQDEWHWLLEVRSSV